MKKNILFIVSGIILVLGLYFLYKTFNLADDLLPAKVSSSVSRLSVTCKGSNLDLTINPNFSFSPSRPKAGQTVIFRGTARNRQGKIIPVSLYNWNFGGGHPGLICSSMAVVKNTYYSSGYYPVTLKVVDKNGNYNTITKFITVR